MHLEDPYTKKLLIFKMDGLFQVHGEDGPSKIGHKDLAHCREQNPEYFSTVIGAEECATLTVPGSHNFAPHSDNQWVKLCEVLKMEKTNLRS